MRFLRKLLVWSLLLGSISIGVLVWFSLEQQPLIEQTRNLSHGDIARAQRLLKQNDPRKKPAGIEQRVRISERDLNLTANYLAQRLKGAVHAEVKKGEARVAGSIRLPGVPLRPYLNVSVTVTEEDGNPRFSDLRIGQVNFPDLIAQPIIREAVARVSATEEGEFARDIVKEVEFEEGRLAVTFLWRPELMERARDTLVGASEREAVVAYYHELARLHAGNRARRGSFTTVLQPLFQLAQRRSQSGADPVSENRALLLVLGAWAINQGMDRLLPREVQRKKIRGFRLTLNRRGDLAQHFAVSAAIASSSDTILADAVGLYKEVSDSQGGSGFSFADLAADRAGTRFGEEATRSAPSARRIQQLLASGVAESDIMPRSKDLPENMNAVQFKHRYGEIGSRDYNRVADEIERRIAACSLYQGS
jgi:hypothetical protein